MWATDASAGALEVAAANLAACACRARQGPPCPRSCCVQGSWLTPLPEEVRGRVDLVVSNPPYVTAEEWAGLDPEVRAEPRQALVAGPGRNGAPGLADVEAVLMEARHWLARPGVVVVELAPTQAGAARGRARQLGYDEVRVEPDLAGRPRALVATARRDATIGRWTPLPSRTKPGLPSSGRGRRRWWRRSWPAASSPCPTWAATAWPCGPARPTKRPGWSSWRPTPTGPTTPSGRSTTCGR